MEIKVIKEKDNPFFKRKDLVLSIKHHGSSTPKTADVRKELAKKHDVDVSQVVVEFIMTKRGLNESEAKVKLLDEKPPVSETPVSETPAAETEETAKEEAPAVEKANDVLTKKTKEKATEKQTETPEKGGEGSDEGDDEGADKEEDDTDEAQESETE